MDVAVVGLGVMGRNHVRVLRELVEVDEIYGVDPDSNARSDVERRHRITTVTSIKEVLLLGVDAAIVATPSSFHGDHSIALLRHGIPTLIEKPIASTVDEANRIIEAAGDTISAVGHVERFNPAIIATRDRLDSIGRLLACTTRRIGPYPSRVRDVGVLMDLLTHDVDAIRYLSGDEIVELNGTCTRALGPVEDQVFAVGRTSSGVVISMEASWLSPAKIREVRLVGADGTLRGDTLLQQVYLEENSIGNTDWEALATFRGVGEGNVTQFAIPREEPLRAELRNFLQAVRGDAPGMTVPLADGLEAVRLASMLLPTAIALAS
ncbi:MAG: UDP-N-acetylglucosamine 3-dehydrogenase [Verrucomicrobiales bacterium]|jgi:UDP-N-acetylglucosamine 3-dehydrogenase